MTIDPVSAGQHARPHCRKSEKSSKKRRWLVVRGAAQPHWKNRAAQRICKSRIAHTAVAMIAGLARGVPSGRRHRIQRGLGKTRTNTTTCE